MSLSTRRVLVAGVGPIPPHLPPKLHAPGLRLWGIASELERRGCEVILCEAMFAGEQIDAGPGREAMAGRRMRHVLLPLDADRAAAELRRVCAAERPDAAIASTDVIAAALALARLPVPICLDFNGHPMTERQMLAKVHGGEGGLAAQWFMILPALLGGDRFAVCCRAQKAALIGELGACGRLGGATADLDLVDVVYPAIAAPQPKADAGAIRGKLAPEGAFIVLSTGGFNTWMDEAALFVALETAMAREPRIHFVATGGAIKGHNEKTFADFTRRVAGSRFKDRFLFPGWVPTEKLGAYYRDAGLAVNIDRDCYEGFLGWRNRMLEWALAEVPIATTPLSELGADLAESGCAFGFPCGGAAALADIILAAARDPAPARAMAARCKAYATEKYSYAKAAEPIAAWLENLAPAPDLPPPAARPALAGLLRPENTLGRFWEEAWARRAEIAEGKPAGIGARIRRALGG